MSENSPPIIDGRSCDGCTLCCKLLGIEELDKPQLKWCDHCDIGTGCKIYGERPSECRTFYCNYLYDGQIGEHWKPTKSRMVIHFQRLEGTNRVVINVDPFRKNAWRKEPYYSQIKQWAVAASENLEQVVVWLGFDAVVVLPDKEINLGPVREDEVIVTWEANGPSGREWGAELKDKDDPSLKKR